MFLFIFNKLIQYILINFSKTQNLIKANGNLYVSYAIRSYIYMKNFFYKFTNKSLKFIKVGSNDGLKNDPCAKSLLICKNWSGALIEPVPNIFHKLKKNYSNKRFSLHQIAISNKNIYKTFYTLNCDELKRDKLTSEFYKSYFDEISTFDIDFLKKYINKECYKYIYEIKVKSMTLQKFIESEFLFKPNFVHIDTEGHDLIVLESLNLSIYKPNILLLEHCHLSDKSKMKLFNILKENKYFILRSKTDILAILNFADYIIISFLSMILTPSNYLIKKFLNLLNPKK